MRKKWIGTVVGIGVLLLLMFSTACALFGGPHGKGDLKSYANTFQGLNTDMRETLHKVREGDNAEANIGLLHDQLHLMRDVLHLVRKGNEQDPNFQKLHELNHGMRESWHKVKKGHDQEQNLQALHDRLHEMKETLRILKGEAGSDKGES